MHDIREALRRVARQPAFAVLVIATLALGIGAATAMFAVIHGVLLKPLPYSNPHRLVWMYGAFRDSQMAAVSPPDFLDYRNRNDVFESLGAMAIGVSKVTVADSDGPSRVQASAVSAGLLSTLGAPAIGRDFTRDEERLASAAIIVTERFAAERFGSAATAIGRPVVVDGEARSIVGIVPSAFRLPYDAFIRLREPVDVFVPLALDAPDARIRRFHSLRLVGRLNPQMSLREAQAGMDVIARQLEAAYPENETWKLRLVPLHERMVGDVRPMLRMLMAGVVLLLLVACSNVASLLVVRAADRQGEIAIRNALGASRWRVLLSALLESAVVSVCGAAAGLLLAWWALAGVKQLAPTLPRVAELALNVRVALFAIGLAFATSVLFGAIAVFAGTRGSLSVGMSDVGRTTDRRSRRRARALVMVAQVAASAVMLTSAGLLTQSFARLLAVDPGFVTANVFIAQVSLPDSRYTTEAGIETVFRALLDRVRAAPQIESVALATVPPLAGATDTAVHPESRPPASPRDRSFAQIRRVQGDYFETLRIPILAGRPLRDDIDRPGSPLAALITASVAGRAFGSEDALGRRLVVDLGGPTTVEIVGVVADVRQFGPESDAPPTVYLSARQLPSAFMHLVVRTTGDAAAVGATLREILRSVDSSLAPSPVQSMQVLLDESIAQPRLRMLLTAVFSSVAVMLTLVGLYGTLAYGVSQRRRELGIRLALGAQRRQVLTLIARHGALIVAAGLAIGLAAAAFLTRFLTTFLFQVQPLDPIVFAGVPVLFGATALIPILMPALRAARVDPVAALRID
jgi:putative ABC transport system permease protein